MGGGARTRFFCRETLKNIFRGRNRFWTPMALFNDLTKGFSMGLGGKKNIVGFVLSEHQFVSVTEKKMRFRSALRTRGTLLSYPHIDRFCKESSSQLQPSTGLPIEEYAA